MAKYSLAKIKEFVVGFEQRMFYVGIDVHKRSYHVALRRAGGNTLTWVAPANPETLVRSLGDLKITIGCIAYEAGPTGFSLARKIAEAGCQVIVAAPSRIPRPSTKGAKTDRLDCIRLALYAANGMLSSISIPTQQQEAKRSLVRRRKKLAQQLAKVKARIKSHLLFLGIQEPEGLKTWKRSAVQNLHELEMEQAARWTLDSLLQEMADLQKNMAVVQKHLEQFSEDPEHRMLVQCARTMPAVGPVLANTFVAEMYQPQRFRTGEQVASHIGLAPMVRQSGQSQRGGRTMKVGQKGLKSMLVEGAWLWQAKDPWAKALYNRLLSHTGVPQKAIIGVARKMAIILWRIILEKRPYQRLEA